MTMLRRLMLGAGLDLDKIAESNKLYYKAIEKINVNSKVLKNIVLKHSYNATTQEGVVICGSPITYFPSLGQNFIKLVIPSSVESWSENCLASCEIEELIINSDSMISQNYSESISNYGVVSYNNYWIKNAIINTIVINSTNPNLKIGDYVLAQARVNTVIAPSGINIGKGAFKGSRIKEFKVDNFESITFGAESFMQCSIKSFNMPYGVNPDIPLRLFYDSDYLEYVIFNSNQNIPSLESEAFVHWDSGSGNFKYSKIIVPDNLYDDWITTEGWSIIVNHIIKRSDWDAQQVTE